MENRQTKEAVTAAKIKQNKQWPHRIREDKYGQLMARMHHFATRILDGLTAQDVYCWTFGWSPAWMKPGRIERRYRYRGPQQWTPMVIQQLLTELDEAGMSELSDELCNRMHQRAWVLAAAAGHRQREQQRRWKQRPVKRASFERLRGSSSG